ncbi:MAG: DnaJ domain-containing protein [Bacteroidota bacterium]
MPDYYAVFNLPPDCRQAMITRTFHRLRNDLEVPAYEVERARNRYIELYEAYEVLKDPFLRSQYDAVCQGLNDPEATERIKLAAQAGRESARNNLDIGGTKRQHTWYRIAVPIILLPFRLLLGI